MKKFKTLAVMLLAIVLAFTCVACGEQQKPTTKRDNDGKDESTKIERSAGLTDEQLENYVVEYTVIRPVASSENEAITVYEPFYAKEVAFGGYRQTTNAKKADAIYKTVENSSFTYTDTEDYRGNFAAHKRYLLDETQKDNVTEIGTETVAGIETKHYQYKSGLFNIHFWVAEEYDLSIKYEEHETNNMGMDQVVKGLEVTSLEFGNVTQAMFDACPTPTPAPDAIPAD